MLVSIGLGCLRRTPVLALNLRGNATQVALSSVALSSFWSEPTTSGLRHVESQPAVACGSLHVAGMQGMMSTTVQHLRFICQDWLGLVWGYQAAPIASPSAPKESRLSQEGAHQPQRRRAQECPGARRPRGRAGAREAKGRPFGSFVGCKGEGPFLV